MKKCYEAGLAEREIQKTVDISISIRNNATGNMESLATNQTPANGEEENEKGCRDRNEIIAGIASTYSINYASGFNFYLNIGRESGIINEELNEIISFSKTVIDMARAHVEMVIDRIGVKQKSLTNKESCCSKDC